MRSTILDKCVSFELRGPHTSLTRVGEGVVQVMRDETDWTDVLNGRPLTDNRNNQMRDLFPSPRDMLRQHLNGLSSVKPESGTKLHGLG